MDNEKTPLIYDPILVDAKTAAKLCGVSPSNWRGLDDAGLVPRKVVLGQRRHLWCVADLKLWAWIGCPGREDFERIKAGMKAG